MCSLDSFAIVFEVGKVAHVFVVLGLHAICLLLNVFGPLGLLHVLDLHLYLGMGIEQLCCSLQWRRSQHAQGIEALSDFALLQKPSWTFWDREDQTEQGTRRNASRSELEPPSEIFRPVEYQICCESKKDT